MAMFWDVALCPRCNASIPATGHVCDATLGKVMPRPDASPRKVQRACRCPEGAEAACQNPDCPRREARP